MYEIKKILLDEVVMRRLLEIWEETVVETHLFLSKTDIENLKPLVKQGLNSIEYLSGYYEGDQIYGFIGIDGDKLEMLFVDAHIRGKGIGKKLINYAINNYQIQYVDVNEQNEQGVGFYKYLGFEVFERSEVDEQGNPFPILHMKYNK